MVYQLGQRALSRPGEGVQVLVLPQEVQQLRCIRHPEGQRYSNGLVFLKLKC